MFDQDSIRSPRETVRRAIYLSIAVTTAIYILVAIVTTNLVCVAEIKAPETALAIAARPFLGETGFVFISVAAVISTASALNATMFSASRLSTQISEATGRHSVESATSVDWKRELSDYSGPTPTHRSPDDHSTPFRAIIVVGTVTAILALYGDLNSITSFASGAFMTIFGGVSGLAFTKRGSSLRRAVIPLLGVAGSGAALVALMRHLHTADPDVLVAVAVIWAVVLSIYWVPRRE
jgi:amino acid transporter